MDCLNIIKEAVLFQVYFFNGKVETTGSQQEAG
jgi:hypothetical protein